MHCARTDVVGVGLRGCLGSIAEMDLDAAENTMIIAIVASTSEECANINISFDFDVEDGNVTMTRGRDMLVLELVGL